jgi:hypothetical protein
LALLVGRGVTTQAPSSSNNNTNSSNTNKRNSRTQSQKKFVAFNIKQQIVVFLKLNCKEERKCSVCKQWPCNGRREHLEIL